MFAYSGFHTVFLNLTLFIRRIVVKVGEKLKEILSFLVVYLNQANGNIRNKTGINIP